MIIKNAKIVLKDRIIENGCIKIVDEKIDCICDSICDCGCEEVLDARGNIIMPGFIDIHIHGSGNIDFMDASPADYLAISKTLYKEGVTTYLATTLTSDTESLLKVARSVKEAVKTNPSLGGIHLEGPYISAKHKGAQNEAFIRDASINELEMLQEASGGNIRYISLAPEKEGALDFIKKAKELGVVSSAGHTDASFSDIEKAINAGLKNTTHTHNAMSGHHHRNPGVVTAAMYFDELSCELICDGIHVCPDTVKTFYKIVGDDRFIIITDALKIKNSDVETFQLFGLDCVRKNGAAYLTSGPLAGSLLTLDQGVRNIAAWVNPSLISLAKISSTNAARAIGFKDRGEIKEGLLADLVMLSSDLKVLSVFKKGKKVV